MPTYPKSKGDLATPVGNLVCESLNRKTGNSLPVNHNSHPSLGSGNATINGPATSSIVPKGSIGSGGFKEVK